MEAPQTYGGAVQAEKQKQKAARPARRQGAATYRTALVKLEAYEAARVDGNWANRRHERHTCCVNDAGHDARERDGH